MKNIFLDTNILVRLAITNNISFQELLYNHILSEFPNFSSFYISDLVFNETHAFLTNKIDITKANHFLISLFSQSIDLPFDFKLIYHNQSNHNKAIKIATDMNYIHRGKGLSMVDALLLIQMSDENGIIYTSDLRMSYYHNEQNLQVAHWFNA